MKKYRRMNLRRLEAALRVRKRPRPRIVRYDAVPVEDTSYPSSPTEIIDLATGPYRARFPNLAKRSDP